MRIFTDNVEIERSCGNTAEATLPSEKKTAIKEVSVGVSIAVLSAVLIKLVDKVFPSTKPDKIILSEEQVTDAWKGIQETKK